MKYLFFIIFFISCSSLHNVVSETKLSEALEKNQGKIRSFRGMGKASFSVNKQEGSVEILAIAEKSGRLRIETGTFFNIPLSILTVYEDKLSYYAISEEKYYVGKTSEDNMKYLLPLELTEKDLLGFLFFDKTTIDRFKQNKQYQLEFFELKKNEKQNLYYPEGLKITHVKNGDFLLLSWDEFDLNPSPFSKIHFQFKKPPQAMSIPLSSLRKVPLFKAQDP